MKSFWKLLEVAVDGHRRRAQTRTLRGRARGSPKSARGTCIEGCFVTKELRGPTHATQSRVPSCATDGRVTTGTTSSKVCAGICRGGLLWGPIRTPQEHHWVQHHRTPVKNHAIPDRTYCWCSACWNIRTEMPCGKDRLAMLQHEGSVTLDNLLAFACWAWTVYCTPLFLVQVSPCIARIAHGHAWRYLQIPPIFWICPACWLQ